MPKLEDRYKENKPQTGQIVDSGTHRQDPEPIGWENPYQPSKDLAKNTQKLHKARGGDIGSGASGYNSSKPYSDKF